MSRAISIIVILLLQNYTILAQNDVKTCGPSQLRATFIEQPLDFPADGEAANGKSSCTWTILADMEKLVQLVITEINFAADNNTCKDNILDTFDDAKDSSNRITKICGAGEHGTILSITNKMIVIMDYMNIDKNKGFKAKYMQVNKPGAAPVVDPSCGKLKLQATSENQKLTFPENGQTPRGPNSCTWTITADNGFVVNLNLTDIQFASNNDSCNQNMLTFFDGEVKEHKLITSVCGKGNHGTIWSTTSSMIMTMIYTVIQKNKGFVAQYKQVNQSVLLEATCGKSALQATNQSQTFTFPGNNEAAPGPNSCTWTIMAENGMVVQLNFTDIEFALTNDTCKENKVQVYDGNVDPHKIITTVCGKGNHSALMSTGNTMIVRMHYRDIKKGKGFTAQYMQVNVASKPHVMTALYFVLSLSLVKLHRM